MFVLLFLLILGFPVLEIYLLFKIGALIGVANTFFYLLASAVFGIGLIRTQGAFLMRNLQASLSKGQVPANSLVHSLLLFFSGAFFIFPGYISDIVGLFLLLPGTRHLVAYVMKKKMAEKLKEGSMRFSAQGFSGGFSGGFGGGFTGFSTNFGGPHDGKPGQMRDVSPMEIAGETSSANHEIIDVTPIKKDDD